MYIIDKPIELKRLNKLYSIKEVALIDDIYYIKTDKGFISADKKLLKALAFIDRKKICSKALNQLKDRYVINENNEINKIDNFKIVKEDEDIKPEINFNNMTFKQMYKYITVSKENRVIYSEMLSEKFNKEYDTEYKQKEFFSKLTLEEHSIFANKYIPPENKLNPIQQDIWTNKTKTEGIDLDEISSVLYETDKKASNEYIEAIYKSNLITDKEYKIAKRINEIIYITLSINIMYMNFTGDNLDKIINVFNMNRRNIKNKNIPRILRLSEEEIIDLIDELFRLSGELNKI